MTKKLSLLLAAVAVVAFAVPAFAQAAPELTTNGAKATKGQTLTGTSTNWTIQGSLGKLACASVAVHGVVNENTGTTVHVADDTAAGGTTASGCKVGASSFTVNEVTLTTLHISSGGKGTFSLDFSTKLGAVSCQFSTASSAFTYVSGASPLVVTLTNVDFVATPAACEPGTVNASLTVTSPSGVVVLH